MTTERDSTFEFLNMFALETEIDMVTTHPDGGIDVEFKRDGKPSGMSVTESTHIALKTLSGVIMVVPVKTVKAVANAAFKAGSLRDGEHGRKYITVQATDLLNYKEEPATN